MFKRKLRIFPDNLGENFVPFTSRKNSELQNRPLIGQEVSGKTKTRGTLEESSASRENGILIARFRRGVPGQALGKA